MDITKNAIAAYPLEFRGTVISPTKICMQFNEVTSKLRVLTNDQYTPLNDGTYNFIIKNTGTLIDVLSVGCQMPVIEMIQTALIQAYENYLRDHSERYREEYGKEFIEFLKQTQNQLNNLLKGI